MLVIGSLLVIIGVIGLIAFPIMWVLGNKNAKTALRNGFIAFLIGGVLLAFNSSTSSNTQKTQPAKTTQPTEATAPAKRPDLELQNVSSTSDGYTRYVTGKIKNNTNRKYGYVQVEINLYDKADQQVGNTLANVNNLEPGAVWSFKAPILENQAIKFKVADITGF
jgi:hypothetical protein